MIGRGRRLSDDLPSGLTLLAVGWGEDVRRFSPRDTLSLPDGKDLSLLGEANGETLFGSTLPREEQSMMKWRLLSLAEQPVALPTIPLEEIKTEEDTAREIESPQETETEEPEAIPPVEEKGDTDPSFGVTELLTEPLEDPIARAERLVEEGEPFLLFRDLMPGSKWAILDKEECLSIIGLLKEGEKTQVFYGVAGSRDYPPDDDRLWTFFPTEEEGDAGFFLTEGEGAEPNDLT